jgi:hypothetical protein
MDALIFFAVFAQMMLTILLLLWMGWVRREALNARAVSYSDIALDDRRWPDNARKISNYYKNQFELPVIFYVLCLIAIQIGHSGSMMASLAWAFVISRVIHAYIHTTSNIVLHRGAAFTAGLIIVAAMMIPLLLRMVSGAV